MKRRAFTKMLALSGASLSVRSNWTTRLPGSSSPPVLPDIYDNNHSLAVCINSRYSFHGGYSTATTPEIIANTLWATARTPPIASERTVYIALPDNLYRYRFENEKHLLEIHLNGDKRTEAATAFEIGVATNPADAAEDAGAALHWAQLESVAFWNNRSNQPACCPKDSATSDANSTWRPSSEIHLVNCFGQTNSVAGLVTDCVAISSDGTLPAPAVDDNGISLEAAMRHPLFGTTFTDKDLTLPQISQILWAAYGSTPHSIGTTTGTSVASWNAKYFLTGRIYLVSSAGVQKFQTRSSSGALSSRDHRLETVSGNDCRTALRQTLARLPQSAPVYIIFCGSEITREQRIEAGYCGSGALLQATALGIQGHYCALFTPEERSAIQQVCGISSNDQPLLVFSAGHPSGTDTGSQRTIRPEHLFYASAAPNPFVNTTRITMTSDLSGPVTVRFFNQAGKLLRSMVVTRSSGTLHWDGRDRHGRVLPPGIYTCTLESPTGKTALRIIKQ